MKRLFVLILLAMVVGCGKKSDPAPTFNCLLDTQLEGGVTAVFNYNDQRALMSYTRQTGSSGGVESHTFTYDANGLVTQESVTVSSTFSYVYNFTYGSDGKVSEYTYISNGTPAGVYTYTRSDNTVTESYVGPGQSAPSETREYSYSGDNVIKEVLKEFYGANHALSSVSTTDRSNFDTGFSPLYAYYSRVNGLPFAYSKNNPEKDKVNSYTVVNGVNQPASTINYIYNYTYNASKGVLTREVSTGSGSTPSVDSYFYSGCD